MTTPQSPNAEQVAMAWAAVKAQLERGTRELVLSFDAESSLGETAMKQILGKFESSIGAKGSILRDTEHSVIRILPPPAATFYGPALLPERVASNARAKVAKDRMAKVPRPPNAFILYRQHFHPKLKAQHPDMHNNEISIKLGQQWQEEGPSTKQHYKDMAEEIKKKHNAQHPTYQYQPRRASEKKRRTTKAKMARTNTSSGSPSRSPPALVLETTNNMLSPLTAHQSASAGRQTSMDVPESSLAPRVNDGFGHGSLTANATSPGFRLLSSGNQLVYDVESNTDAAIFNMRFSEDAADDADYDEALVDWNSWTSKADHAQQQTLLEFQNYEANLAPEYNTGISEHGAPRRSWQQHNADAYLRHGRLHTEFEGRPRSQWNLSVTATPKVPELQTMTAPMSQNYQNPSMYMTAEPPAWEIHRAAARSTHDPATAGNQIMNTHGTQSFDSQLPSHFMNGDDIDRYSGFMAADDGLFTNLNYDSNFDDGEFILRLNSEP